MEINLLLLMTLLLEHFVVECVYVFIFKAQPSRLEHICHFYIKDGIPSEMSFPFVTSFIQPLFGHELVLVSRRTVKSERDGFLTKKTRSN